MNRFLALKIGGFAALVLTSVLGSSTTANAANVGGCGFEPAGGTLHRTAGICELTFYSVGVYSWTLPAGIADLYGIAVGGGGGADYSQPNHGYAGAGGSVEYVNLTSSAAGDDLSVEVGAGGHRDLGDADYFGQGYSSAIIGSSLEIVSGGLPGILMTPAWGNCDGGDFGENIGAGDAGVAPEGGACVGGGPGIVPDTDPHAPAIFAGFTTELGHGGGVYLDRTHTPRIGEGANVRYQTGDDATIADATGADGAVIFRYTASDANNVSGGGAGSGSSSGSGSKESLAYTGNQIPIAASALASLAIISAGIGAIASTRRRSRASR